MVIYVNILFNMFQNKTKDYALSCDFKNEVVPELLPFTGFCQIDVILLIETQCTMHIAFSTADYLEMLSEIWVLSQSEKLQFALSWALPTFKTSFLDVVSKLATGS